MCRLARKVANSGAPGRARTCDPRLRRPVVQALISDAYIDSRGDHQELIDSGAFIAIQTRPPLNIISVRSASCGAPDGGSVARGPLTNADTGRCGADGQDRPR